MGSKSQRQKERHTKKRQVKRQKQKQDPPQGRPFGMQQNTPFASGANARHRQRLAQQIPRAWEGETREDVAVFDDSVLATLPAELAEQVVLVREVLQEATESRGEEAVKRLSVISRGSPLSEWRLFIRGLVDWLASNTEAASEVWKRLDLERRPGRIATAMMIALRSDLEQISHLTENREPEDVSQGLSWGRWDDQLLYHGKLLRRMRFDRTALRIAEAGVNVPEESKDLLLGPDKIHWLRQFVKEYGDTEPDLAAAISQTALRRAFAQEYFNLFDDAVASFPGPRHDRRNHLLSFFFYIGSEIGSLQQKKAERALDQYLNHDLPQNEALSESLRGAIASQIHFNEAMVLIKPDTGAGMFDLFYDAPVDPKQIRKHLRAALKADPGNLAAHKAYSEWVESNLDDVRLTQARRKPLEEELAEVMRNWSKGLPEDVKPRLWLVDYLLENEQMDEARPHVDFLAASRMDDPRVRATPWKWQLLEAMRLCRRKAWLADVPARLDEAEVSWPAWLSKQWLPYLRAAWTLRSGQAEAFESQRQQICRSLGVARDSLVDACMMLGAAQQMRVSAEDLKPLRAPVDQAVKKLKLLSIDELMAAGAFFWDLQRTKLLYPAYRMHGNNIGKELFARLAKATSLVLDGINNETMQKVILWGSESRFWSNNDQTRKLPFFSNPAIQRHPIFVAARLNSYLKERYFWGSEEYRELGTQLREAAQSQRDAYYRHWFLELADELDDKLQKKSLSSFRFPFGNMFRSVNEEDDDDDENIFEDDDQDFEPECDCADCQAARRAYEKSRSPNSAK